MTQRSVFVATCLVCVVVSWHSFWMFDGTEFGAGELAGNSLGGGLLLILAAILVFKYPRAASAIGLLAFVLFSPLYVYLLFPRPFRKVWPGDWSVPTLPRQSFVWNGWWALGILSIALVAVCPSYSSFAASWTAKSPRPESRPSKPTGVGRTEKGTIGGVSVHNPARGPLRTSSVR